MRIVFTILFLMFAIPGLCQLVIVPVQKEIPAKKSSSARTQDITPITLPFWDDFSAVRDGYVNPVTWEYGQSVWVNSGMSINAPSLNVATLDGLDSLGKPYNVNDVLAKGFADKLISAPIRMDLPTATERLAIALTFFYEFQGNGEPPDAGDLLSLSFKNDLNQWEVVWSIENDGTLLKDKFIPVTIPISNTKFFHDKFQFRFQNFARLSGPYDTWHLDYIYISNGKSQTSPVFPLFPDRTISTPITSLFPDYRAMPIKHFFSNTATNMIKPTIAITNLRIDQVAGNGQPVSYFSTAKITMFKDGTPPVVLDQILDNNVNIGSELSFAEQEVVTLQTIPDPSTFAPTSDSIHIKLTVGFDTGDDKIKTPTEGDYDFNVFNPIVFKTNDSLSARYVLSDYYAYDDGKAEYGAGLNQPGAQLAYQFTMRTDQPDTIVAVDMYFPRFGDESNQIIQFKVLRDLTNSASSVLYQGNIPIQRNTQNKFWRVPLAEPAGVTDKFYIGWEQTSSAVIAVGLDKNTDSGDKIFSNINGSWEQNTTLKGSLMIRPVFGKGSGGPITGIDKRPSISVYPNPNQGTFYVSARIEDAVLYDLSGRRVDIGVDKELTTTKITMLAPVAGLYLLRTFQNSRWTSSKVVVR
ncbi:MAG: T9SS type A sorting domain-containing protein [Cyclobacteriaceae bacterium]